MRDLAIAIVVSVLVSAGISYWMVRQLRDDLASVARPAAVQTFDEVRKDPTIIAIQITPAGGGRCTATTDPLRQSFGAGPIHWIVRRAGNNVNACFSDGQVVKIVPKSGNTSPLTPAEPFDSRLIKASHGNVGHRYFYDVVMANSSGGVLYPMEDPELEIVEVQNVKK